MTRADTPTAGPAEFTPAEARAAATVGSNYTYIHELAARVLRERAPAGGLLLDLGCGAGKPWPLVRGHFQHYLGVDAVPFDGFPNDAEFRRADLSSQAIPIADEVADCVAALGVLEFMENPSAFFREMHRVAKPGALLLLTTANVHSLLNKVCFLFKGSFSEFQNRPYSSITPILHGALRRMGESAGWSEWEQRYTNFGRIPGTRWHWPSAVCKGCWCSDAVLVLARKPAALPTEASA